MKNRGYILEIGFDIENEEEQIKLENLLRTHGYAFYTEPPNNFCSLEDLECQCEGK